MGKREKDKRTQIMFRKLEEALNNYHPSILETLPKTPNEIYSYYAYVDKMYVWLKNEYQDSICGLCNEMRAILGHLSEYDLGNEKSKDNLQKAYGHFRRLSIDILKILCNGLDMSFGEWINKYAYYDFSNIDNEYFPQYVMLYNEAHKAYIEVQKLENLGSDRGNHIIEKYHTVAKLYYNLYNYHLNDRRVKIEKRTIRFKCNKVIWVITTLFLTVLSVLGAIL